MKKSVLALAVLALSGTAMAQVTLTGLAGFAYQKAASDAKDARGFNVPDLTVFFGASDDLGGGAKLTASAGLDLGGARNAGATRNDYSVAATGGFGKLEGYSKEAGNIAEQFSGVVSLNNGPDSTAAAYKSIVAHANVKGAAYTTPALVPGLKVKVGFSQYEKNTNGSAQIVAPETNGYYTGTGLTVSYAMGPVAVAYGRTQYNNADVISTQVNTHKDDLGASYDLGVVKFGLGYVKTSSANTVSATGTLVASVAVPVGPVTLGLDYATKGETKNANGTVNTPKISYTAAAAKYSLSKASWATLSVGRFDGETAANIAAGAPTNGTQFRLGVWKSF
jgi:predicted porin